MKGIWWTPEYHQLDSWVCLRIQGISQNMAIWMVGVYIYIVCIYWWNINGVRIGYQWDMNGRYTQQSSRIYPQFMAIGVPFMAG